MVLTGAADYIMPFYTDNGGADGGLSQATPDNYARRDADFAEMKADGYNTVRVPLSPDVYGTNPYFSGGSAAFLARLQAIVASAQQAGLYVIFGWWGQFDGPVTASSLQPLLNMQRDVANLFRTDPTVMYEPINEPYNVSWAQWQSGMAIIVNWWRTTIGYHGPLFIDTINW